MVLIGTRERKISVRLIEKIGCLLGSECICDHIPVRIGRRAALTDP